MRGGRMKLDRLNEKLDLMNRLNPLDSENEQ
jgi:hypothetical protein